MKDGGKVRVYVGTRKGAYVLTSDKKRRKWAVKGPFREGQDVFHVMPDPRNPGDVYMGLNSWWFGPMIFKSKDFGAKWEEIPTPMMATSESRPQFSFDSPEPPKKPITNIWHIEPGSVDEPKTIFAGVDPGQLFRSDDSGQTWKGVPGINDHPTRGQWNPGAGGLCLHSILVDAGKRNRMYIGISAAGTFRSDDGGETWRPNNKGVTVDFLPEKNPELGQCVHKIAQDHSNPNLVYRQDHNGIYVSRDATESWDHIGTALKGENADFGFVTATPLARPGTAYFVPLNGNSRITQSGSMGILEWSEKTKKFRQLMPKGKFPGEFGMHREGLAVDDLDAPGIYVGSTSGDLFVSPDAGKSWMTIPHQFPAIQSLEVSSPASSR